MNLNELSFTDYEFCEASSNGTLGKVSGEFFAVDAASQNGRFYTRGLWEKTIQRTKEAMKDKKLLGYLGHETSSADENLAETAIVTTDLHISKDGKGKGVYEVLDTVPGRALHALLKAGVKLAVSSRANGSMSNEKRNGIPIVDEASFSLKGFDIVLSPGVKSAVPSLVESLNESLGEKEQEVLHEFLELQEVENNKERLDDMLKSQGEEEMEPKTTDKSILESLAKDKTELEGQLSETLDVNKDLTAKVAVLESKLDEKSSSTTEASEKLIEAEQKVTEVTSQLSELKEAIEGDQRDLTKYEELATIEEAEKALDVLESYSKLGSVDELEKILGMLETYAALGSVDDLEGIMDKMEEMLEASKAAEVEAAQKDFIEETGVSETVASKLLEKFSVDEAKEIAGEMSGSINIGNTFHKADKPAGANENDSVMHKSLGARLYENC